MLSRLDIQRRGRFHAGRFTHFWLKLSCRSHPLQDEQKDEKPVFEKLYQCPNDVWKSRLLGVSRCGYTEGLTRQLSNRESHTSWRTYIFAIRKTLLSLSTGGQNPSFRITIFTVPKRPWMELSVAAWSIQLTSRARQISYLRAWPSSRGTFYPFLA